MNPWGTAGLLGLAIAAPAAQAAAPGLPLHHVKLPPGFRMSVFAHPVTYETPGR